MSRNASWKTRNRWAVPVLGLLIGCSLIFPPRFERLSRLIPQVVPGGALAVEKSGVVAYAGEGVRIEVEHLSDRQLNELFPRESSQGKFSINPYTYGDYVDPAVGYVRNRFTVFRVTVHNISLAKVELQPRRCLLTTDREGEVLPAYGVVDGSAPNNLESYYRTRRGTSGNEEYRFSMRMGVVKANNYREEEKIYKGEQYGGFIVFDPLAEEVEEVTLHIRDFILKFNAYDKPLQTVDIAFPFTRQVSMQAYERQQQAASAAEATRVSLRRASQVSGQTSGDLTRDPNTIDAFVRTRLGDLNPCFQKEFAAGAATAGEVVVRFVVLSHGGVESAELGSSAVGSKEAEACILNQVRRWRFRPSGGGAEGIGAAAAGDTLAEPGAGRALPVSSARVMVTCTLGFADIRGE